MGGEGLGARLVRLPAIGLFTSFFSASLFGLCNVIVKGVSDTLYLGGNHQKRIDAGGKCGSVHNRLLQIHWNRTSRLLDPHFQKPSKCLCSDCFCPLIIHCSALNNILDIYSVFLSSWNIHPGSVSKGQSMDAGGEVGDGRLQPMRPLLRGEIYANRCKLTIQYQIQHFAHTIGHSHHQRESILSDPSFDQSL